MIPKPKIIVGIDEVGRGPLAGPLVAAAVAWPAKFRLRGLTDSKLLTRKQRTKLAYAIQRAAIGIGVGWASHDYIDQFGLTAATTKAMTRALRLLDCWQRELVIDGSYDFLQHNYGWAQTVIGADSKIKAVSAASIIAKVARDNYMWRMSQIYPRYHFENHVGYSTPEHHKLLLRFGPSPIHRLSFRPLQIAAELSIP